MSLNRSVRISQMLQLHRLPENDSYISASAPLDWCEIEEQRRTWWVIYLVDRLTSATTGWPALINDQDVSG